MQSLHSVGSNDDAYNIAKDLGFKNAEALKADYVADRAIRYYDMYYDKDTKEIVLIHKNTKAQEWTGLFLRRWWKIEKFVPEIAVSISFTHSNGEDFVLNELTQKFEVTPTRARLKKDYPIPRIGQAEWYYEIREKNCDDMLVPFQKLVDIFKEKTEIINQLCSNLNLEVSLVTVIHAKIGNRPLNGISKEIVKFMASIDADMGFDLYCYNENNELLIEEL